MKQEDWTERYEAIMDSIMATKEEEMYLDELAVAAGRILGYNIKVPTIDYWCKNMVEKGYLCRQNRSYKKPTGKHRETKRYVYFVNPPYDRQRIDGTPRFPDEKEEEPDFDILPKGMNDRPKTGTLGAVAEIKVETKKEIPKEEPKAEPKQMPKRVEEPKAEPKAEPVPEKPAEDKKDEEKKERELRVKRVLTEDFKMRFAEALEAMYNGKKVVSEATGTVYSVRESNGQRGVFSNKSGKPILMFPPEEMTGTWHVQGDPCACPWCGSHVTVKRNVLSGNDERFLCECTNPDCMASGPKMKSIDEAITRFNEVAGAVKE